MNTLGVFGGGVPRLAAIALLSLLPTAGSAAADLVGSIRGAHGPPALTSDAGGAIAVAYVARPGADADIYAWRLVGGPAEPKWPAAGLAVCTAPGDQLDPIAASDGHGGILVAWNDFRNGRDLDIYCQHLLASGRVDPAWPQDGVAVCVEGGTQALARIVPFGEGGALLVWEDLRTGEYDVYFQHVLANGKMDPAWPANGRPIVGRRAVRMAPAVVPDGIGGAIVAWEEGRTETQLDIIAQHFLPSGDPSPKWPEGGLIVSSEAGDQVEPAIATDGAGGVDVLWSDARPEGPRLMAQRVIASGSSDPHWPRGGMVVCDSRGMEQYPSMLPDSSGGAFVAWQDGCSETASCIFLQHFTGSGKIDSSWPKNGLAASAAIGFQVTPHLAFVKDAIAVTWLDRSVPANVRAYTQHVLRGGQLDPAWPAEGVPLSAEAVDDLVLGSLEPGAALAVWRHPGSWTIQAARLPAEPAELAPQAPARTMLFAPRPNPAHSTVTLRFTLARRQPARLTVFDIEGRRVATPIDQMLDAGPHEVVWDRYDVGGNRVANGMYFLRLDVDGMRYSRRLVLLR